MGLGHAHRKKQARVQIVSAKIETVKYLTGSRGLLRAHVNTVDTRINVRGLRLSNDSISECSSANTSFPVISCRIVS